MARSDPDKLAEERQLEWEQWCISEGVERWISERNRASARGEMTVPKRYVVERLAGDIACAIQEQFDRIAKGRPGPKTGGFDLLARSGIRPEVAAHVALTAILRVTEDDRSGVGPKAQTAVVELGRAIHDELVATNFQKLKPALFRAIRQRHGQQMTERRSKYISRLCKEMALDPVEWDGQQELSVGWALLALLEHFGLVGFAYRKEANRRVRHVSLDPDLRDAIADAEHRASLSRPYRTAMLCPPVEWDGLKGGGYLSLRRRYLVKRPATAHREALEKASASGGLQRVLDAVNSLQRARWRLNRPILETASSAFRSGAARPSLGLPPRRDRSECSTAEEHNLATEAIRAWRPLMRLLDVTNRLDQQAGAGAPLYFTYELDSRGRVYAVAGSGPNPQGGDLERALLEFHDGKPVGAEGGRWIAIHLANCWGHGVDKRSFDERVQWVKDNTAYILASAAAPLGYGWWEQADKPWRFLAACMDWAGYVATGQSPDYVSRLPVAVDGSNNGLQHYAALLLDEPAARSVNLLPCHEPQDIYAEVAAETERLVLLSNDNRAAICRDWFAKIRAKGSALRKLAKQPTMTLAYGATDYGRAQQVREALVAEGLFASDQHMSPEMAGAAHWLANRMGDAIAAKVRKQVEAMQWLREAAKSAGQRGIPLVWTAPSGFPACGFKLVEGQAHFRIAATLPNGRQSQIKFPKEGRELNPRAMESSVAANFVHALDAAHLVAVVNAFGRRDRSITVIHDSFGTHAADMGELRRALLDTFVEQYSRNHLEWFASDAGYTTPPPTPGTLDIRQVREAEYAFG